MNATQFLNKVDHSDLLTSIDQFKHCIHVCYIKPVMLDNYQN